MSNILTLISLLIVCLTTSYASNRCPNHNIKTLKLLQIVHREGDRTPSRFTPNDPFKDKSFWVEGFGQLTTYGKSRMYKLGQFIRDEYNEYLGDKHSPREVYARSSTIERSFESVASLLAGAYPPVNKWQWSDKEDAQLGNLWQPIPIQTLLSKYDDLILEEERDCPAVDKERERILSNNSAVIQFFEDNKDFYNRLSAVVGKDMSGIQNARAFHGTLNIEMKHNYYWTNVWTKDEEKRIVDQLYKAKALMYRHNWDSGLIKRLRAGGLVKELNANIQKVLKNENEKKIYVYSTHNTVLAVLMQALGIFNDSPPPFGAALVLELHQRKDLEYFLRAYYQNETEINAGTFHALPWTECQHMTFCPLNQYLNFTKPLLYEDFDKECKQ